METRVKGRWSAPWILLSCIALGAIPGLVAFVFGSTSLRDFGLSAFVGSIYALSIGIPCWTAIPPVLCRLDDKPLRVRLTVVLCMLAVFGVIGCLATNLIMLALGISTWATFSANFW